VKFLNKLDFMRQVCECSANVSSIKLMNLKKAALCGLFFYFPKNKFIVFFLFLLFKDFFEAKTHA